MPDVHSVAGPEGIVNFVALHPPGLLYWAPMSHDATDGRPTVMQAAEVWLPWSEVFTYRLLAGLRSRAEQVVLARRFENLRRFPWPDRQRVDAGSALRPTAARRAALRLRTCGADLLHAHHGYSAARFMLLTHFMRLPMIVTFGGRDLAVDARRQAGGRLCRYLFDAAAHCVAVSDDLRALAIDLGCAPERISTVHRGVSLNVRPPLPKPSSDGPINVLMVGRFVPKKGHEDALCALMRLSTAAPLWKATLIGNGAEKKRLAEVVRSSGLAERVQILDAMSPERLRERMSQADIMLHPSRTAPDGDREGVPNVLMEAMAAGLPVVATRHGGIPELVEDAVTGLLVPEADPDALAAALERMIRDRSLRERMGAAGELRVRAAFSLDAEVDAYMRIYVKAVQEVPHGRPAPTGHAALPDLLADAMAGYAAAGSPNLGDVAARFPGGACCFGVLRRALPAGLRRRVKSALAGLFTGKQPRDTVRDESAGSDSGEGAI
jgi:glycosyltransferase involved in cell wall biosynthesis